MPTTAKEKRDNPKNARKYLEIISENKISRTHRELLNLKIKNTTTIRSGDMYLKSRG